MTPRAPLPELRHGPTVAERERGREGEEREGEERERERERGERERERGRERGRECDFHRRDADRCAALAHRGRRPQAAGLKAELAYRRDRLSVGMASRG